MDEGLRKRLQWPDCRDNYRVIGFAALLPIAGIAATAELDALEAGGHGAILGIREGFGIDDLQLKTAAGDVAILLEEGPHTLEVLEIGRRRVSERL